MPPLRLVDGALLVSPTQLDDIRRCFQYWGYKHVWRREPNVPAAQRDCGKAGHAGLEALVKARLQGATEDDARNAMERALLTAFKGITVPEDEAWRTPIRYLEALHGYCDYWGEDSFKTLACEVPFAIRLGEVPYRGAMLLIILRGVIDRVLQFEHNVVAIGDYKFKKDWSSAAQTQYERDPQFKLYALALTELQRDHPELGLPGAATAALIDVIVLRAPFTKNYGEAALAKMKPRTEYKRARYPYTPEQLEESRQQALGWVAMAVQQHEQGRFVQAESRCSFFFGNAVCPMLEVCKVPVEQRGMVLASDYFRNKVERELTINNDEVGE